MTEVGKLLAKEGEIRVWGHKQCVIRENTTRQRMLRFPHSLEEDPE
jgi:hypothetical protein